MYWHAELAANHQVAGYAQKIQQNLTDGRGLMLMGSHGVGKTYTALAIAIRALHITRRVLFMTAPDLVDSFKPGAAPFDPENGVTMETALRGRDLLVIDDLGHEYKKGGSEFAVQMLVNLLRYRVTNCKATIITTNLGVDDIESIYTEGMRSLLAEHCGGATILKGQDRRRDSETIKRRRSESGLK